MIGERIGSYRILRLLREGSLATLYEAVKEPGGERAAVKVLHRDFSKDAQIRHRFQKEARAVEAVNHPVILGVFEAGELPSGLLYMISEHPDGESLYDRIQAKGRMGLEILPLFQQVAAALAAAHERGIVHRNLKPDSIYIVSGQAGEQVKIGDFGIAKVTGGTQGPDDEEFKTNSGVVMGTPAYMAPEQYGDAAKADGKSDVYSLGAVLYEALCGKPPFGSRSTAELIAMHVFKKPTSPSEVVPSVPAALSALVLMMLAKESTERPAMDKVAAQLDLFCHSPDSLAAAAGPAALSSTPIALGRRPQFFAFSAALLVVIALAVFFLLRTRS